MGLIGSAIGGITSAVGGAFAAKAQNQAYKQQQEMYNQRLSDVKAHRDAVYYADPTQSAENQAAVTQAQQLLTEQNKRAAASNAVTGGTDESVAMAKGQTAATVGNMMQQQAVQGAAKKEQAYQQAESQIDNFSKYIAESKLQQGLAKAKNITDAASGLANTANSLPW